jgi:hypothetical protein
MTSEDYTFIKVEQLQENKSFQRLVSTIKKNVSTYAVKSDFNRVQKELNINPKYLLDTLVLFISQNLSNSSIEALNTIINVLYKMDDVVGAMHVVAQAVQKDDAYAISWQSNIAMLLYDFAKEDHSEDVLHGEANRVAGNFIEALFGRNTEELFKHKGGQDA